MSTFHYFNDISFYILIILIIILTADYRKIKRSHKIASDQSVSIFSGKRFPNYPITYSIDLLYITARNKFFKCRIRLRTIYSNNACVRAIRFSSLRMKRDRSSLSSFLNRTR